MDSNTNLRSQSETQVGPVGREDSEEVSQHLSQAASKSGNAEDGWRRPHQPCQVYQSQHAMCGRIGQRSYYLLDAQRRHARFDEAYQH
jgi:hypothetical protein